MMKIIIDKSIKIISLREKSFSTNKNTLFNDSCKN